MNCDKLTSPPTRGVSRRRFIVHCQSGARSAIAASVLRSRGLANVVNLTGGFADWQNAGHPVERAAAPEELVGVK